MIRRLAFGFVLAVLLALSSLSGWTEAVYALMPLRNDTLAGGEDWVGLGVALKLRENLALAENASFVPFDRLEQAAHRKNLSLNNDLEDWQARQLRDAAGATDLVWGRYQVSGAGIRCEIFVLRRDHTLQNSFSLSGKAYRFGEFTQRVFSELYRVQGLKVPAPLRRHWQQAPPLDAHYRHYVEARREDRDREDCIESLRLYLKHYPKDLQANLLLAEWSRQGTAEEAIEIYKQILQWSDDCGLAHANLAFLLAVRQQRDEARAHYEKATRCPDQYPELYFNYGNLLRRKSLETRAIRTYQQGIERFPEAACLYFNLGLLYKELGRSSEASQAYREASRLDKTLRQDFFDNQYYLNDRWISLEGEQIE